MTKDEEGLKLQNKDHSRTKYLMLWLVFPSLALAYTADGSERNPIPPQKCSFVGLFVCALKWVHLWESGAVAIRQDLSFAHFWCTLSIVRVFTARTTKQTSPRDAQHACEIIRKINTWGGNAHIEQQWTQFICWKTKRRVFFHLSKML